MIFIFAFTFLHLPKVWIFLHPYMLLAFDRLSSFKVTIFTTVLLASLIVLDLFVF